MRELISEQEILDIVKHLATPIDFDELTAKGVLKKSGAWYIVLEPNNVPHHAWQQVVAMKSGSGKKLKLKFTKSTKNAEALYNRIAGRGLHD